MIYFITDRRPNEPLHPPSIFREPLYITRLQCDGGALIATEQAPEGGWTHQRLLDAGERLSHLTRDGADAYLGTTWVGSTEV